MRNKEQRRTAVLRLIEPSFGQVREQFDFADTLFEYLMVFIRGAKVAVAIVLALTLSAHWLLLQSAAWTGMMIVRAHQTSFKTAIAQTFDGQHPCCLCRAIAAGKKSEKTNPSTAPVQKLEFPPVNAKPVLLAPSHFQLLPTANSFAIALTQKPPVPPPRGFFV